MHRRRTAEQALEFLQDIAADESDGEFSDSDNEKINNAFASASRQRYLIQKNRQMMKKRIFKIAQ